MAENRIDDNFLDENYLKISNYSVSRAIQFKPCWFDSSEKAHLCDNLQIEIVKIIFPIECQWREFEMKLYRAFKWDFDRLKMIFKNFCHFSEKF